MTREQKIAEKYVADANFDPGYVNGFLAGVKWQKTAAQKSASVNTIKGEICPNRKNGKCTVDW